MTEPLMGRSYTRARRLPLMIGRLPGTNGPLWGGPYTLQQVLVASVAVVVMWQTHFLWARFSGIVNAAVFFAVPVVAAFALRRARVEGRNPLRFVQGVLAFYRYPATGVLAGRRWTRPGAVLMPAARIWVAAEVDACRPSKPTAEGGSSLDAEETTE